MHAHTKLKLFQKMKYLKQSQNKQVLTQKKIRMFKNWETNFTLI